jgi:Beta-lactamase enzyme family
VEARKEKAMKRALATVALAATLGAAGGLAGTARADVPGPITTRVDDLLSAAGGTTGLYLKRVGGPVVAAKNESLAFEPASSIKVLIHLYAMQRIQNDGLDPSTPIPVYEEPPPKHSCPGGPTGSTEPLSEALKRMMRYSNNAATKELMIYFGVGNLQAFAASLGLTSTHFELSASPPGFNVIGCQAAGATNVDDHTTSLVDLGKIYEGVADSSLLGGSFRDAFYERMAGREMVEDENYDFTGVWPTLMAIVDDETPAGMYSKKKQLFLAGIRENAKGGGYTKCLASGCTTAEQWLIMDGWLQVPVCANDAFSNRKYVWGVFISGAVDVAYFDGKTTPADTAFGSADVEPLREQVHDALAGWSACFEATPPTITLAVDPSDQVAPSGWYNLASSGSDGVLAHFTATDASGIDFLVCAGKQAIPTIDHVLHDLNGTIYCGATDGVGNKAVDVPFPFKIDQRPPTVTCAAPVPTFVLGGPGGSVAATVTDAMSGPTDGTVSAPADVSSAGPKTVPVTGHDVAGNSTTVACPYVVAYKMLGFFSPLPKETLKAGSTVPVKLALADAGGVPIPDAEAAALAGGCAVTVAVGGAASCLGYDPAADRFQANVKLPNTPGPATLLAEVTIGGTVVSTLSIDVALK